MGLRPELQFYLGRGIAAYAAFRFTPALVAVSRCSVGHGLAPRAPGPSGKRLRYSKFGEAAELAALRQTPPLIPNFSVPRARRSDWGANPWPTLHREYGWGDWLGGEIDPLRLGALVDRHNALAPLRRR
jgi:hypothetical protein